MSNQKPKKIKNDTKKRKKTPKLIFCKKNNLGVFIYPNKDMDDIEKTPKNAHKFSCNYCTFICSKKSDWSRHILRPKHILNEKRYNLGIQSIEKTPNDMFVCECGKSYQYSSGLWRHSKKCNKPIKVPEVELLTSTNIQEITPELIIELIKQNKELQQTLIDQNKTIINLAEKTGNTYYNNNNNKTFNLQIFLNETCKDAINLTDFVDQIKLSINDLEETGKIGYVDGISRVFIKNLNGIDFTKRPIHCSDSKRETIYIKDDDQWQKDDDTKTYLTKAIKQVANKNIKQISEWQKLNPNYIDPESKQNDKYMKIVLNSMSGSTKEEAEKNYEKIAKNIAKETIIDK